MRRHPVNLAKEAGEVEFGKTSLARNIVEVDRRRIMVVNEKFCPYDPLVEILFGIEIHRLPVSNKMIDR